MNKAVMQGMALETDVMKKISFQLGRLPSQGARERVASYIDRVIQEDAPQVAGGVEMQQNGSKLFE